MDETIRAAVLSISDTRTDDDDVSGKFLKDLVNAAGFLAERTIVSDAKDSIIAELEDLSGSGIHLIITTGGTGFSPRDNAPEATLAVIEREAPGLAEAMRRETYSKTPMAMLSRGVCGIRGKTLIINLPGSPKAVEECFVVIKPVLRHAVDQIRGVDGHKHQ
jgi:molybdenum cofactor synthesis domain-containing protein